MNPDEVRQAELLIQTLKAWVEAEQARAALRDRLNAAVQLVQASTRYIRHLRGYDQDPDAQMAYEKAMVGWVHAQGGGAKTDHAGGNPPSGGSSP